MGVLDSLDICKYVAACAKKAGMSVVWEKEEKPRTNGHTIYLPIVGACASVSSVIKLKQFVKHETSHVTYSDFSLLNEYKPEGLLAFINNLLEDHRVDWLNDSEYEGDRQNTNAYMDVYANERKGAAVSADMADILAPLFAWDAVVREDLWLPTSVFSDVMSEKGKAAVYDKLVAGDYADVLRNVREVADPTEGGKQVYALALRILTEVFGMSGEKEEEEGGEEGSGDGEGDDAGTEGEDGAGEKVEGEFSDKRLREVDAKGEMIPYSEHKASGGVNLRNYSTGSRDDYVPTPLPDILVVRHYLGEHKLKRTELGINVGYLMEIDRASGSSTSLTNAIRTQLQIISRDRWEYGKKSGKLCNGSLYRVGMKDAKGFNERLFKRQIHNDTLDVAVQILVDCSGSMSGDKYVHAAAATCILNDVLSTGLHIPLDILGFTEVLGGAHTIYHHKEFDRQIAKATLAEDLSRNTDFLLDNVDGESIVYGYDRLIQRKEKRKIMVVLSDGCPLGGHSKGSTKSHTRKVIKAVEAAGRVELLGVGIMYDGVRDYYKKSAYIPSAEAMESTLLSLISRNIIRSV